MTYEPPSKLMKCRGLMDDFHTWMISHMVGVKGCQDYLKRHVTPSFTLYTQHEEMLWLTSGHTPLKPTDTKRKHNFFGGWCWVGRMAGPTTILTLIAFNAWIVCYFDLISKLVKDRSSKTLIRQLYKGVKKRENKKENLKGHQVNTK
jgi:hypothetical protein